MDASRAVLATTGLRLPHFHSNLLNSNWQQGRNRAEDSKINTAALSVRCSLAAMCGMHVHTTSGKKKHDVWAVYKAKYTELIRAMRHRYPDATVMEFIDWISYRKIKKKLNGQQIYRLSQVIRKACVNTYCTTVCGSNASARTVCPRLIVTEIGCKCGC